MAAISNHSTSLHASSTVISVLTFLLALSAWGCNHDEKKDAPMNNGGTNGDGDSDGKGDPDSGGDAEVDSDGDHPLREQFVAALCDALEHCPGHDFDTAFVAAIVAGDCEDRLNDTDFEFDEFPEVRDQLDQIEEAVTAGRTVFDEDAFTACLDGVRSCTPLGLENVDCETAFKGTGVDGTACVTDVECQGTCDSENSCGGSCVPHEEDDFDDNVSLVGENESCGFEWIDIDAFTYRFRACDSGLVCTDLETDENGSELGTCQAPLEVGEACNGNDCAAGLGCVEDKCRQLVAHHEGETCNLAWSSEDLPAGNTIDFCDPTERLECDHGVCEQVTGGKEGDSCQERIGCIDGLFCDVSGDSSVCAKPRAVGDDCFDDDNCASGVCDWESETCAEACQ